VRRHITLADLPAPYATPSVDNGAHMVPRPDGAMPHVPPGFAVQAYAEGLDNPRKIVTAPNGDLFVVESGPGKIRLLRGLDAHGHPVMDTIFASGHSIPMARIRVICMWAIPTRWCAFPTKAAM